MGRFLSILLLIIADSILTFGQTFPVSTIYENGPRDKRINVVYLGDGYRINEMDKFRKDVQAAVEKTFMESPYKEYSSLFNIYAIEVPSNESGTDHSGTASDCYGYHDSVFTRDTYFNTTFDYNGIHRLLVAQDLSKVYDVLFDNFPDYDMVLMVVNHEWYGGSGGTISVFSTNTMSSEIAIHEAGHTFAYLADEYEYGGTGPVQYDGFNVTWRTDKQSIPWSTLISPDIPIPTPVNPAYFSYVGLFEGAYYYPTGMYRPKFECKMRVLNVPFCEVCIEQHVRAMFNYISVIDEKYPENDTITVNVNLNNEFSIKPVQLFSGETNISWRLDNDLIAQNTNKVSLAAHSLSAGRHELVARAAHVSPFVKNDPFGLLQDSLAWIINASDLADIEEDNKNPAQFILSQNYPNPFNPKTIISYSIPKPGFVTLKVYDIFGKEISSLVNKNQLTGSYKAEFDGSRLPSGVYIYRLKAGEFSTSRKLLLVK